MASAEVKVEIALLPGISAANAIVQAVAWMVERWPIFYRINRGRWMRMSSASKHLLKEGDQHMSDDIEDLIESDEYGAEYNSDPAAKTVAGFIEALQIFAKHMKGGMQESYFCSAEHDELFIHVGFDEIDPGSEDGHRLNALGFHASLDTETWSYFT